GATVNSILKYKMSNSVDNVNVKSNQVFFTLSYGIFDRLSLDGKIGTGDIRGDKTCNINLDYNAVWSGGYGFRAKAYENEINKIKIICGVHHISVHPSSEEVNSVKYKPILDDNQIDTIISKEYDFGIPYAGCKVSRSRLLRRDNSESSSMHSRVKMGLVFGYDVKTCEDTYLNIETRLIDETAFNVGISRIF
ncbi:MAG: hypothetical protein NTZ48_06230, partial [Candidatus Omnitrophica bacterium]|nr:hypothetical protein [Candidatus Omnitrophota bacterium]